MPSIQAYKEHKQEGTIAATTLVSKVHKQGALGTSFQASLHRGSMIIVGHANCLSYKVAMNNTNEKLVGC